MRATAIAAPFECIRRPPGLLPAFFLWQLSSLESNEANCSVLEKLSASPTRLKDDECAQKIWDISHATLGAADFDHSFALEDCALRACIKAVKSNFEARTIKTTCMNPAFLLSGARHEKAQWNALASRKVRFLLPHHIAGRRNLATAPRSPRGFAATICLKPASSRFVSPLRFSGVGNNIANIRMMNAFPSSGELSCTEPFRFSSMLGSSEDTSEENAKLDQHFGLLREDFVAMLRDEVQKTRGPLFPLLRLLSIDVRGAGSDPSFVVGFEKPRNVNLRIGTRRKAAQKFFSSGEGQQLFEVGKPVIFLEQSNSDEQLRPSAVGIVTCRRGIVCVNGQTNQKESTSLGMKITVSFPGNSVNEVLDLLGASNKQSRFMLSPTSSATLHAIPHEALLRALKDMECVPLDSLLCNSQRSNSSSVSPPALAHGGRQLANLSSQLQTALAGDPMQRNAVQLALDSRLVLVDGPPGTGKTAVGVNMVKAMIESERENPSGKLKILILCSTNHGLSSFLQALMNGGVSEDLIVQLGHPPSSSSHLLQTNLDEMGVASFTDDESRDFLELEERVREVEKRLHTLQWVVTQGETAEWSSVAAFLRRENGSVFEQLAVPEKSPGEEQLSDSYLWDRWCLGQDRGQLETNQTEETGGRNVNSSSVWDLSSSARLELRSKWVAEAQDRVANLLEESTHLRRAILKLRQASKQRVLNRFAIVAATSKDAIKHRDMLLAAAPSVVLVEEAEQMLESEVLACLGENCEQLVLIGDKKATRPKVHTYAMRKEAGNGLNLDESLFERLVLSRHVGSGDKPAGPPVVTLDIQRRMSPEISRIVRELAYPNLLDDASTLNKGSVAGMGRNVLLFDHRQPDKMRKARWDGGRRTWENREEALMALRVALHCANQDGCSLNDVTILTPFLGQLALIQRELTALHIPTVVSEEDRLDAARYGLELKDAHMVSSLASRLRVATVDNFNGQKAEIAVISLVRSNEAGAIGFLASPERVNLLLSRARRGMFILGNSQTLLTGRSDRGRELWRRVLDVLEERNAVLDHFPVLFPTEQTARALRTVVDFNLLCRFDDMHSLMRSKERIDSDADARLPQEQAEARFGAEITAWTVPDVCPYGHTVARPRGQLTIQCRYPVTWQCVNGHTLTRECYKGRPMTCSVCDDKQAGQVSNDKADAETLLVKGSKQLAVPMRKTSMFTKRLQIWDDDDGEQSTNVTTWLTATPSQPVGPSSRNAPERLVGTTVLESQCSDESDTDKDQSEDAADAVVGRLAGDLASVLRAYNASGFIKADNVLDGILKEWRGTREKANTEKTKRLLGSLDALQFILRKSIHPSTNLTWTDAIQWKLRAMSVCPQGECLAEAVSCWAKCLMIQDSNPSEARTTSTAVLQLLARQDVAFPTDWLKAIGEIQAANVKTSADDEKGGPIVSESLRQWDLALKTNPRAPAVMEEVLKMTGIEPVKLSMINLYHRIQIAKEQKDTQAGLYNIRFEGGPGTGKTTVAKHYATMLQQLGVVPEDGKVVLTSGAKLIHDGVQGMLAHLQDIKEAGGGVVIVDETYQLSTDLRGKQVLDFLLPLAEHLDTPYGPVVWVFAGYPKDMEKLFEHNPGMPSRFPHRILFPDFTDDELQEIFVGLCVTQPVSTGTRRRDPAFKAAKQPPRHHANVLKLPVAGLEYVDHETNKWVCDGTMWIDEHGNSMPYCPDMIGFGADWNPITTPDGSQWTLSVNNMTGAPTNPRAWVNEDGIESCTEYPKLKAAPRNTKQLRPNPFRCQHDKHKRMAIRRIAKQRGNIAFANARTVNSLIERVKARQSARIETERRAGGNPDLFLFVRDDLLGPKVTVSALKASETYRQLQAMEGLAPVKAEVDKLIDLVAENQRREEAEEPVLEVVLNRIFLGNPGTGKTTVAELYAKLLGELGLLSKGEVVLKTASDFIGSAVGNSEQITRSILQGAQGSVLVIDEAYSLYASGASGGGSSDPYRTSVIDTIVEQVQARAGDDRAVVLLGYEEEMKAMLRNVNPGLSRRFQLENAFYFDDFSDESLLRIMLDKASQQGLQLDLDVAKAAVAKLAKERAKMHFGNAGAVENLLSVAKLSCKDGKLEKSDFGIERDGADDTALDALFSDLIGIEDVRGRLEALRDTVAFAQQRGDAAVEQAPYGVVFTGSPGTGKTTVARRMGQMYQALGLLGDCTVVEVSASDLVTGYMGQTGKRTREVLDSSRGGVLFIDEAYQMDPTRGGAYMAEAVDELVKLMTSKEFQNKVLIILAGYEGDMEQTLSANPGLKSRFPERLRFQDFDPADVKTLMTMRLETHGLCVQPSDDGRFSELCEKLTTKPDFGNGRDVDTWSKLTYQTLASRCKGERNPALAIQDLAMALNTMMETSAVSLDAAERMAQLAEQISKQQYAAAPAGETQRSLNLETEKRVDHDETPIPEVVELGDAEEMDLQDEEDTGALSPTDLPNPFQGLDSRVLRTIQDFLDENGLNNKDQVARLANDSGYRSLLAAKLAQELGMPPSAAVAEISKWSDAQTKMREQQDGEQVGSQRKQGMEAIWRCAVCGKADKPWIVCHVAPYIVGYRRRKA